MRTLDNATLQSLDQGVDLGTDGQILTHNETTSMSKSSNLQFVDTNILIYAHMPFPQWDKKHVPRARDLVRELWQSGEGCLSVQVLQEFYVNVTQKVAKPMPSDVATRIICRPIGLADTPPWGRGYPGRNSVAGTIQDLVLGRHDCRQRHTDGLPNALVRTSIQDESMTRSED